MDTKAHILQLLAAGQQLAVEAEKQDHPKKTEVLAGYAIGYFDAAAALLNAFGALHNEMSELPQFVAARQFTRRFR